MDERRRSRLPIVIFACLALVAAYFLFDSTRQQLTGAIINPVKRIGEEAVFWKQFGQETKTKITLHEQGKDTTEVEKLARTNDFDGVLERAKDFREKIEENRRDIEKLEKTGAEVAEKHIEVFKEAAQRAPEDIRAPLSEEIKRIEEQSQYFKRPPVCE